MITLNGYFNHPQADSLAYPAVKHGVLLAALISEEGYPHNNIPPVWTNPVLMKIPALHPYAIPIAWAAVSPPQDVF